MIMVSRHYGCGYNGMGIYLGGETLSVPTSAMEMMIMIKSFVGGRCLRLTLVLTALIFGASSGSRCVHDIGLSILSNGYNVLSRASRTYRWDWDTQTCQSTHTMAARGETYVQAQKPQISYGLSTMLRTPTTPLAYT